MTNWIKDVVLFVFYFGPIVRYSWKKTRGRLHYFRNESNDFLRYMQYELGDMDYLKKCAEEDETYDRLIDTLYELNQEIRLRKRQGTWPH